MRPWQRVVIDTNVWISAALSPQGLPSRLIDTLLLRAVVVFSEDTFAGLSTRLWKPKFDRYLSLESRHAILHDLGASAHWVEIPAELSTPQWSRDPDDDAFIRAALAGGASHLISGDGDLLELPPIADLCIVSPAEALTEIDSL